MTTLLNNASVLAFLLNKIPYGVVLCNKDYQIVLWNEYANNIVGESVGTVDVGEWVKQNKFFTRDGKELSDNDRALYKAVKNNVETASKTIVKLPQKDVYLETEAYPLHDEKNNVIGGAAFFKDVTNQVQVGKLLNEILDKLNDMQVYLKDFMKGV